MEEFEDERAINKAMITPRSVNEFRDVEISKLILSLRSRINFELSHALVCLTLLSTSSLVPEIALEKSEELFDELLELLVDESQTVNVQFNSHPLEEIMTRQMDLHKQVCQMGANLQPQKDINNSYPCTTPINKILYVTNIIRNLSTTTCNHGIIANSTTLIRSLLFISDWRDSDMATPLEVFQVRNDTLQIVSHVARSLDLSRHNSASDTVRTLFDFFLGYLANRDEQEAYPAGFPISRSNMLAYLPPYEAGVPYWKDLAIESATVISTPESNREIIASSLSEETKSVYIDELLKLIPQFDKEFHLLNTESTLAHMERLSMALYNFVKISPKPLLSKLREDSEFKQRLFRVITRLAFMNRSEWERNPFHVVIRRTIETLRLVNDLGVDDTASEEDGTEIMYGFGSSGEAIIKNPEVDQATKTTKVRRGLLADRMIEVQSLLLIPFIDRVGVGIIECPFTNEYRFPSMISND